MAGKTIRYGAEARQKLQRGVDKVANAVKVTLGPKGRHVLLKRSWGAPHVTRDGVTIAKEISLKDQFEDLGAHMVKTAAPRHVMRLVMELLRQRSLHRPYTMKVYSCLLLDIIRSD